MHGSAKTKTRADPLAVLQKLVRAAPAASQTVARDDFATYRAYIHPDLIQNWWTESWRPACRTSTRT